MGMLTNRLLIVGAACASCWTGVMGMRPETLDEVRKGHEASEDLIETLEKEALDGKASEAKIDKLEKEALDGKGCHGYCEVNVWSTHMCYDPRAKCSGCPACQALVPSNMQGRWRDRTGVFYGGLVIVITEGGWYVENPTKQWDGSDFKVEKTADGDLDLVEIGTQPWHHIIELMSTTRELLVRKGPWKLTKEAPAFVLGKDGICPRGSVKFDTVKQCFGALAGTEYDFESAQGMNRPEAPSGCLHAEGHKGKLTILFNLHTVGSPFKGVSPICRWTLSNCDETLSGKNGADYRGCQAKTRSGKTCQEWAKQSPHTHWWPAPAEQQKLGLAENYCRNPMPDQDETIWCYTTESKRWEYCDPVDAGPATCQMKTCRWLDYGYCQAAQCSTCEACIGEVMGQQQQQPDGGWSARPVLAVVAPVIFASVAIAMA